MTTSLLDRTLASIEEWSKSEFPEDFAQIDKYKHDFPLRTFEIRAEIRDKRVEKIRKKPITALDTGFCLELPSELNQLHLTFVSESRLLYAWFDKPGSYQLGMFMTSSLGTTIFRDRTNGIKKDHAFYLQRLFDDDAVSRNGSLEALIRYLVLVREGGNLKRIKTKFFEKFFPILISPLVTFLHVQQASLRSLSNGCE